MRDVRAQTAPTLSVVVHPRQAGRSQRCLEALAALHDLPE
jgi:hypothetical protein